MPHYEDSGAPPGASNRPVADYVKLLTERFPHVKAVALQLLMQQETFRELCEEYEACTKAAERLEGATAADDRLRKEYSALRLRLEAELLRYIAEHPQNQAR